MPQLQQGDIAIGGKRQYVEVIDLEGANPRWLVQQDDEGRAEDTCLGVTFDGETGDLYAGVSPQETTDCAPHDVCWFPDGSGILAAVVTGIGQLEFRKYSLDLDDEPISVWTGMATDQNWAREPVKIDIACDSRTVFYTDSMRTIFRYDLEGDEGNGAQLDLYDQLPDGSAFIYGGVRVLPVHLANGTHVPPFENGPVVVVAMTKTGTGPRRAVCLGTDQSVWTDEVNPSGSYRVIKRRLDNGAQILTVITQATPMGGNGETLSLASFSNPCLVAHPRIETFASLAAV